MPSHIFNPQHTKIYPCNKRRLGRLSGAECENSELRSSKSANNSRFRSVSRVHDLTHLIMNSTKRRLATARQPLVFCSFCGSYCSLLSEESQTIAAQPEFHFTLLGSPKNNVAGQKKPKFSNPASNKLH